MPKPKGRVARRRTSSKPATVVSQTPASSLGDAPVTITLTQLHELQARAERAEQRATQLEADIASAKATDPTGTVGRLRCLVRDGLLPIVRFAIANLPPAEIPKWPWKAVEEAANDMIYLPDYSADDDVLANELHLFVADIQEHELARSRKRAEAIASAPSRKELAEEKHT